jgi:hypothetical protein
MPAPHARLDQQLQACSTAETNLHAFLSTLTSANKGEPAMTRNDTARTFALLFLEGTVKARICWKRVPGAACLSG